MARTIRRKNGYDHDLYCVYRRHRRNWLTGVIEVQDPWFESWKYHNDSWCQNDGRFYKYRTNERLRVMRRQNEYDYKMALHPDDVTSDSLRVADARYYW